MENTLDSDVISEYLLKTDQCLVHLEDQGQSSHPPEPLLSHFKGQFFFGCGCLILKKAENSGLSQNMLKLAHLLFSLAYRSDMSSQFWSEGGARRVVAGYMIIQLKSADTELNEGTINIDTEILIWYL